MNRQELIDSLETQVTFVKANSNRRLKVTREMLTAMNGIKDHLTADNDPAAVECAKDLKRIIESQGGIVKGAQRVGPHGMEDVTIYTSETAKQNHRYVCGLLATVEAVTADAQPQAAAAS